MRKITEKVCQAFIDGEVISAGNCHTDEDTLYLHCNAIAKRLNGKIYISNAGWLTTTTKERLNGLLTLLNSSKRVVQKDFSWYIFSVNADHTPQHLFMTSGEWYEV